MAKRVWHLFFLLLLLLTWAVGCGKEEEMTYIWESQLSEFPEVLLSADALALDKNGRLLTLTENQVHALPLAQPEAEPSLLCELEAPSSFHLLAVDLDGNLWLASYGGLVCAFSPEGALLYEYYFSSTDGVSTLSGLCALPEHGAAATVVTQGGTFQTYAFQLDQAEPTELPALRREQEAIYFAGPTADGSALLGWDATQIFQVPYAAATETGQSLDAILEPITTLEACGLAGARMQLLGMTSETCILLKHQDAGLVLSLNRLPTEETTEKTILSLAACIYMPDEMNRYIALFNAENQDVLIRPVIYNSVTEMNLAVTSGDIPDLFVGTSYPFEDYAEKGIFEDLYPYIEADGLDLVDAAMRTHEIDGKLYRISSGFGLCTFYGHEDYVGTALGWTWDEFEAAIAAQPENSSVFRPSFDRWISAPFFLTQNLANFVDWPNYTAKFDSENFKSLLSFMKSLPETPDAPSMNAEEASEAMCTGKVLGEYTTFASFSTVMAIDNALHGGLSFKGFPSDNKQTSYLLPSSPLSITTACSDKEAAWDFISGMLSEDFSPRYFPMNQALFDRQAEETEGLTQAQYEKTMALVNASDTMMARNNTLESIIVEEASAYFADERSLDETCAIIQSRAQTYLNERKG